MENQTLKQKTLNILKKDRFESIKDKYNNIEYNNSISETKEEFFNRIEKGGNIR